MNSSPLQENSAFSCRPRALDFARSRPGGCLLSIATAALLVLAQPPYGWAAAGWLALAPLVVALRAASLRRRLGLGVLCGFVWSFGVVGVWLLPAVRHGLQTGWIGALAIALAATQLFGGLYMVLFCAFADSCRRSAGALGVAVLWVATEWLRGRVLGGLPWGFLGYAQWAHPRVIQIADAVGVLGVSFVLALAAAALAGLVLAGRGHWRDVGLALAMVLLCLGYGTWRLDNAERGGTLPVAVVSSAWPRVDERDGEDLLRRLMALEKTVDGGAALSVWPEGALRFYLQDRPAVLQQLVDLAQRSGAPLLLGGPRYVRRDGVVDYYNSAFLIDGGGMVSARDKRLLVPLAEQRLPLLPGVERAFSAGRELAPLPVAGQGVGTLICFEVVFAELVRARVAAGATVLVNITSDVLLGAGAEQMAAMAVLRSVENRVPLLRVANLGPTLLVDAYGRIVARERGFSAALWQVPLSATAPPPPQWRMDAWFGGLCALLAALAVWRGANKAAR